MWQQIEYFQHQARIVHSAGVGFLVADIVSPEIVFAAT
jgi:hypothetical protein